MLFLVLTMADASVRLPNFCLINGLKTKEQNLVLLFLKEKTYLLCRHRKICIGIGITSSLSDDKLGLVNVSR
jgi:hypothetical protein